MAINGRVSLLPDGMYIRELERVIRNMEERIKRLETQAAQSQRKS